MQLAIPCRYLIIIQSFITILSIGDELGRLLASTPSPEGEGWDEGKTNETHRPSPFFARSRRISCV